MMGVMVPVYKRRRGGVLGDQDPNIDQAFELHSGYKIVPLEQDEDDAEGR